MTTLEKLTEIETELRAEVRKCTIYEVFMNLACKVASLENDCVNGLSIELLREAAKELDLDLNIQFNRDTLRYETKRTTRN